MPRHPTRPTSTLTVRLPADLKARFLRLAAMCDRSPSELGAAAVADFVEREWHEAEEGRLGEVSAATEGTVPADEALAEARAAVEEARAKRRAS